MSHHPDLSLAALPRRVRVGLLATVLAGVVLLAGGPSAPAASAATAKKAAAKCDAVAGWSALVGTPQGFAAGAPIGLYVWNQKGTWIVAATGPDRRLRLFQGSITFDAPLVGKPVGLDGKSDLSAVGANAVGFTFKNFGRVDSIAVSSPCATTVTVTGTVDGVPLATTQVFLGASGVNPTAVPAVVRRESSSSSQVAPLASAPDASACPTNPWPSNTVGRPTVARNRRAAAFQVWNEKASGAWQAIAVAESGRPQLFEGRITVNAPAVVAPIGLEGADAVRVDGNTVVFSFRTSKAGDGFQIFAPCASQLVIEVSVDGVPLTGADVLVGPAALPAPVLPLTISR